MKYKHIKNETFQVIPYLDPDKSFDDNKYKRFISALSNINTTYIQKGAGQKRKNKQTKEVEYFDVPNVSYKLWKQQGKIYQYLNAPSDLVGKFEESLFVDIKGVKLKPTQVNIPDQIKAFTVQGSHVLAINLDQQTDWIKKLFSSISDDEQLIYSLTVKEAEDHSKVLQSLERKLHGDDWKATVKDVSNQSWNVFKNIMFEKKTQERIESSVKNIHGIFTSKKEGTPKPLTQRKLQNNRYLYVQPLFLYSTTDLKRVERFKSKLQQYMNAITGENELKVIEIEPNLSKVTKGHLDYSQPTLCLYQKELDQFLYLPSTDQMDSSFYYEQKLKTEIPKDMYEGGLGAIPFARDLHTNQIIYRPRPETIEEKDDYSTPEASPGQMGGGKTIQAINQVVGTFCLEAKNREEWKKYARSAVVFDVADGEMIQKILNLVPDWLMDRVKLINHYDTDHPIPVNFHDLLKLNKDFKNEGSEFMISQMETELLLDSLNDSSSTISIERYYQNALQASYAVGEGHILEALRILTDKNFRNEIINRLDHDPMLKFNLKKDDRELSDEKSNILKTIDNHLSQVLNNKSWMDCITQEVNEEIDFWKWTNGDDGAYLVLIYIPNKLDEPFRNFLFAHYFLKTWKLMLLRESLPKDQRKECLLIVDEIHKILGQRAVQRVFGDIFKEPRKYRFRYYLTFHGWSSLEKAGRRKSEILQSMKDSGCNLVMLKGGPDTFESVKSMFEPYTVEDFLSLMNMEYGALFKVAYGKRSHTFIARLLEPAEMRLKTHRQVVITKLKNELGRPKLLVRQKLNQQLDLLFKALEEKEQAKTKGKSKHAVKAHKEEKELGLNLS